MRTLPCLSPENHPCREKRGEARGERGTKKREKRKTNHVNRKGYTIFMTSSEMFKVRKALERRGEEREKTKR